jgi:hypothetical protein
MKRFSLTLFFVFVFVFVFVFACSPSANKTLRSVLDIIQIGCIIANAESDDANIQKACGVADDLLPDLRKIVAQERAASRRYAAEHASACSSGVDAGAKDEGRDAP